MEHAASQLQELRYPYLRHWPGCCDAEHEFRWAHGVLQAAKLGVNIYLVGGSGDKITTGHVTNKIGRQFGYIATNAPAV